MKGNISVHVWAGITCVSLQSNHETSLDLPQEWVPQLTVNSPWYVSCWKSLTIYLYSRPGSVSAWAYKNDYWMTICAIVRLYLDLSVNSAVWSEPNTLLFTIWWPDEKRRLSFEHAAGFILSPGLSPCSPFCLPASCHVGDLNEVVRVSNRRWWSFSWTETSPACLLYCTPPPLSLTFCFH